MSDNEVEKPVAEPVEAQEPIQNNQELSQNEEKEIAQASMAESPENPYPDNPEYMNTMPQPGEDYNMNGQSMNQKASATHENHFWKTPKRGNMSTDREYARVGGNWDARFHVSASDNNRKSHTFYKQFFGKPTRSNERIVLKPKKKMDPYLENETKSRFPRYSKIRVERDVDREFSWVNNFAVTQSKNNNRVHNKFKEYFDKPVTYNGHITVATSKGIPEASMMSKISNNKPTATVHILKEERGNKYALKRILQKSIGHGGMIPFLRDHNEKYTLGSRALKKQKKHRTKSFAHKMQNQEYGWHQVGYPISMHNEKNHPAKRLKFEDL
jgi:hypothetical protein